MRDIEYVPTFLPIAERDIPDPQPAILWGFWVTLALLVVNTFILVLLAMR